MRCGDLFPNATAEQSCQAWGSGVSIGLSRVFPDTAVVADITVDISAFAYPLVENGLPTFVGVAEPTLAVCISDFTVPSAVLDGSGGGGDEDWGGNGRVAAALDFLACPGGGGGGAAPLPA